MEFLKISFELIVGFFALLILTRVLGKTTLSQITAFDFISAVILGELVGNAMFDEQIGLSKILFGVVLWGSLIYITEMITQKFRKSRSFLEGGPTVVVYKGKIDYGQLKKARLDLDQLMQLMRAKDVFSIQDVFHAILETDGTLSVMKKESNKKDYQNPPPLPITLILDGEVISENLSYIGWDEKRLWEEMKKQKVKKIQDVLIAEWTENQPLYVQLYEKTNHPSQ